MQKEAINCKTEELAVEVLSILDKQGYKWFDGYPLTEKTCWGYNKEDACYRIDEDNKIVNFAYKALYEREGYQIISSEDFINQNKTKNNMKNL